MDPRRSNARIRRTPYGAINETRYSIRKQRANLSVIQFNLRIDGIDSSRCYIRDRSSLLRGISKKVVELNGFTYYFILFIFHTSESTEIFRNAITFVRIFHSAFYSFLLQNLITFLFFSYLFFSLFYAELQYISQVIL